MFAKDGCKAPRGVEIDYQVAEQLRRETHLTLIAVSLRVFEHTRLTELGVTLTLRGSVLIGLIREGKL
jgi:hypothetical protein